MSEFPIETNSKWKFKVIKMLRVMKLLNDFGVPCYYSSYDTFLFVGTPSFPCTWEANERMEEKNRICHGKYTIKWSWQVFCLELLAYFKWLCNKNYSNLTPTYSLHCARNCAYIMWLGCLVRYASLSLLSFSLSFTNSLYRSTI